MNLEAMEQQENLKKVLMATTTYDRNFNNYKRNAYHCDDRNNQETDAES